MRLANDIKERGPYKKALSHYCGRKVRRGTRLKLF